MLHLELENSWNYFFCVMFNEMVYHTGRSVFFFFIMCNVTSSLAEVMRCKIYNIAFSLTPVKMLQDLVVLDSEEKKKNVSLRSAFQVAFNLFL